MNHQRHRALIVEDEPEAAADLVEILRTCGCDAVIATNRRDAAAELERAPFCIILLDLQIKAEPDSIRGHFEHGRQLLKDARSRYPQLCGAKHSLPIVVLSGFASETEAAVAVMRDGASDLVQKLSTREHKTDRIYEALEASGRTSHRACVERAGLTSSGTVFATKLILAILGDQDGRRVVISLGQRRTKLTHASLKILLHLVKARLLNSLVHKTDLGARSDRGFRGVSVLRSELANAYDGDEKELVTNDQRGSYGLAERVGIGHVATEQLARIGDREITRLAREISRLFDEIAKSAGKD
jgi:CheY-like chemotaxis protein